MSKIGKQPIEIPEKVSVKIDNGSIEIEASEGKLKKEYPNDRLEIKKEEGQIKFTPKDDSKETRMLWGTWRSLVENMINGVQNTFEKKLVLKGLGYKCHKDGEDLVIDVGYSHPITITPPEEIEFETEQNEITVKGTKKQKVGNTAAFIRSHRPPEPYQGTGIRYEGENIRRKEGKKAVGLEEG